MSYFKEIVTKAVVGKGRKNSKDEYTIIPENRPSTILGCWIINHNFKGVKEKDSVKITGTFDTNIWYSTEDNKNTCVAKETVNYEEVIPIKTEDDYDGQDEVIIRVLKQPTCTNAEIKDDKIIYTVEKSLASELVGDTKIKIEVDNTEETSQTDEEINDEVKEDFLK